MDEDVSKVKKKRNNLIIMLLLVAIILSFGILEVVSYVTTVQNQWVKFVDDCDCKCTKFTFNNTVNMPNVSWSWDMNYTKGDQT
jgi:hypothetical protein